MREDEWPGVEDRGSTRDQGIRKKGALGPPTLGVSRKWKSAVSVFMRLQVQPAILSPEQSKKGL